MFLGFQMLLDLSLVLESFVAHVTVVKTVFLVLMHCADVSA